jgi:hypothetical protein
MDGSPQQLENRKKNDVGAFVERKPTFTSQADKI